MLGAKTSFFLVLLSLAAFAELTYPAGLTVREIPFATLKPWLELSDSFEARLGGERLALGLGDRLKVFSIGNPQPLTTMACPGDWDLTGDGQFVALLTPRLELRDARDGKLKWQAAARRGRLFLGKTQAYVTTSQAGPARGDFQTWTLKADCYGLATGLAGPRLLLDRIEMLTGNHLPPPQAVGVWEVPGGRLVLSSGMGSQLTFVDGKGPHRWNTQSLGDHDWLAMARNGLYFLRGSSIHPGDRSFSIELFQKAPLEGKTVVEGGGDFWSPFDAQNGVLAYGYENCLEVLDQRRATLLRLTLEDASQAQQLAFGEGGKLTVVMSSGKVYTFLPSAL